MHKGFTLSEVLITLGIVGVVAVLTIPGVMKNYQNRLYATQLEKIYAQISDAAQMIMNDQHVDSFYETNAAGNVSCNEDTKVCTGGVAIFLDNYFKLVKKNCKASDEPCVSQLQNTYKSVAGQNLPGVDAEYCVQTISGATICGSYNNSCTSLLVDVNGLAAPNIAGRDVFSMDIHQNGSISDYGSQCVNNNPGTSAANCTLGAVDSLFSASSGCMNNVMEAGWRMEY